MRQGKRTIEQEVRGNVIENNVISWYDWYYFIILNMKKSLEYDAVILPLNIYSYETYSYVLTETHPRTLINVIPMIPWIRSKPNASWQEIERLVD